MQTLTYIHRQHAVVRALVVGHLIQINDPTTTLLQPSKRGADSVLIEYDERTLMLLATFVVLAFAYSLGSKLNKSVANRIGC